MENTGLILEGGGMRGAFTAGVLDYFMDKKIWLSDVYGVSAGSAQACNYLSNQRGRGIRLWTEYVHDKRYCSLHSLITTGDLFGAEMSYDLIPNHYDLYDYDEFLRRKGRFISVVMDIESGKPAYLEATDMRTDLPIVRASCALPLVSNIVEINGHKYLDGGLVDSVPIRRSIEEGHTKNVVVLTQDAAYRKSPNKALGLLKIRYRKYPEVVRAAAVRHEMYNETLDFINTEEREGRAFVLRPDVRPDIGRVERNVEKLKALYASGYAVAQREHERLLAFLES